MWNDQPVAFCATIPLIGRTGYRRVTRLVTLPDYQGVGIGSRLLDTVADFHHGDGYRVGITTSHPAMIAHLKRCANWLATDVKRTGARNSRRLQGQYHCSAGRAVVSFAYMGGRSGEPKNNRGPIRG
jgi:GNAT superfamily N-acetyltransferase